MSLLTRMEKLWFPGFVLFLQATMLVLFGVLVEYDEFGAPHETPPEEDADLPDSVGTIRTFYPRMLIRQHRLNKYSVCTELADACYV